MENNQYLHRVAIVLAIVPDSSQFLQNVLRCSPDVTASITLAQNRQNPPVTPSSDKISAMSSRVLAPNVEADIWARLVRAHNRELSADLARFLLSINFGEEDEERMQELADRSSEGTLTSLERAEMDGYLHIANLLAVLQSNARIALKSSNS